MHSLNHISHITCLSVLLKPPEMTYSRINVHKQHRESSQVGGYSQHGGLYWIYAAMEWWVQPPHNGIKGGFVESTAGKDEIAVQLTLITVTYLNAYPEHGFKLKTVRLFTENDAVVHLKVKWSTKANPNCPNICWYGDIYSSGHMVVCNI